MQLAVIGEVNGHVDSLRAVLESVTNDGILTILQTGNLAGSEGGDEVIALLQAHGVQVAQGETDRLHLRFEQKGAQLARKMTAESFEKLALAHTLLSSGSLEYLRQLHKRINLTIDGISVVVCHGSLSSQGDILDAATPAARFERQREETEAKLVVTGGSQSPYHRWVSDTLFMGPGPLCTPTGHAAYAIVDTDTNPWSVSLHEKKL